MSMWREGGWGKGKEVENGERRRWGMGREGTKEKRGRVREQEAARARD